jgi:hypothetical protein
LFGFFTITDAAEAESPTVLLAAVTDCATVPLLDWKLLSLGVKVAVMVCAPAARLEVVQAYTPDEIATPEQRAAVLPFNVSVKSTVPAGFAVPDTWLLTVAVNVTD